MCKCSVKLSRPMDVGDFNLYQSITYMFDPPFDEDADNDNDHDNEENTEDNNNNTYINNDDNPFVDNDNNTVDHHHQHSDDNALSASDHHFDDVVDDYDDYDDDDDEYDDFANLDIHAVIHSRLALYLDMMIYITGCVSGTSYASLNIEHILEDTHLSHLHHHAGGEARESSFGEKCGYIAFEIFYFFLWHLFVDVCRSVGGWVFKMKPLSRPLPVGPLRISVIEMVTVAVVNFVLFCILPVLWYSETYWELVEQGNPGMTAVSVVVCFVMYTTLHVFFADTTASEVD